MTVGKITYRAKPPQNVRINKICGKTFNPKTNENFSSHVKSLVPIVQYSPKRDMSDFHSSMGVSEK